MRTIVAGSRGIYGFRALRLVDEAIAEAPWQPTVIISGTARGVGLAGEQWAKDNGVPVERFPADWNRYGRKAGPLRNVQMADSADAMIAIWDGQSAGTKHMIEQARVRGLFEVVLVVTPEEGGS